MIIASLFVLWLLQTSITVAPANSIRIIDGDTVALGNERIRIENIDTPERGARAECDAERMLASVASRELESLLGGRAVQIERSGRDRYGRTLARLRVNGADVGAAMVELDVAVPWAGRTHDWCR